MIAFCGSTIPLNFMEVDGQELSKIEHHAVFENLKGSVVEVGDKFVLPTKMELVKLFNCTNDLKSKIILKLR